MWWGMIIRMECMNKIVRLWVCGMRKQWSDDGCDMDVKCVRSCSVDSSKDMIVWEMNEWFVNWMYWLVCWS